MTRRSWLTWFGVLVGSWWILPANAIPQTLPPCEGSPYSAKYRADWAKTQCTVCARYGFHVINGVCEEDFESVKLRFDARMDYAHRPSCVALGRKFPHLQYHKDYKRH